MITKQTKTRAGGAGVTSCITASPVARAGGGGGHPGGSAGPGGGAYPGSGTVNTGGGGGGSGGLGGSGVVLIKYKFQN